MTAQRTVILAMFAMFAGILYQQYKAGGSPSAPTYKRLWAVGVVTLVLGAAADFAPQVVVPFAIASVISFYLLSPTLLANIGGKGGAQSSPSPRSPKSPATPTRAATPLSGFSPLSPSTPTGGTA